MKTFILFLIKTFALLLILSLYFEYFVSREQNGLLILITTIIAMVLTGYYLAYIIKLILKTLKFTKK